METKQASKKLSAINGGTACHGMEGKGFEFAYGTTLLLDRLERTWGWCDS